MIGVCRYKTAFLSASLIFHCLCVVRCKSKRALSPFGSTLNPFSTVDALLCILSFPFSFVLPFSEAFLPILARSLLSMRLTRSTKRRRGVLRPTLRRKVGWQAELLWVFVHRNTACVFFPFVVYIHTCWLFVGGCLCFLCALALYASPRLPLTLP